jgi:NAD(P)-dependent dehydrogenase (short-subunit alcohol dehydrogenase family)
MAGVSSYNGFSLQGKNALVTGATRGIGLAIAKGFLESGATVTLCGRKPEGVQQALAQLQPHSAQLRGVAAHVGQADDLNRLLEAAETAFGPVQILVNCAATNPYFGPIIDAEDWAWDKTLEVNLKAPYRLARALAKKMAARGGGSIINVASIAGLSAAEGQGIYSVSKAGLIMLTKVMARELGKHNVRVNCLCPGVIRTKFSEALWKSEEAEAHFSALKALGRIGEPDEIVGAAIYLASDASSFTTGAILQVDGGMVM